MTSTLKFSLAIKFTFRFIKKAKAEVNSILEWCFMEKNVLKVKSVKHHVAGKTEQQTRYRVKDEFVLLLLRRPLFMF